MQDFVTWHEEVYDDDNGDFIQSIDYCAYIDTTQHVILSKTLCNENDIIKFKNELLVCKQLMIHCNEHITLFALFENGVIETITTNPYAKLNTFPLNYLPGSLTYNEPILKMDIYNNIVCTISTLGVLRIRNTIVLIDTNVIDFKIFNNKVVVFYINGDIELYLIDTSIKDLIKFTLVKSGLDFNLITKHKHAIKHLFFYKNILVLSLHTNEIICSIDFEVVKTTAYYTIIETTNKKNYNYIVITDLCIYNLYYSKRLNIQYDIDNYTSETCCSIDTLKHTKHADFFKQFIFKYSYINVSYVILVMMDDTIRTFFYNGVNYIKLFDIFESYPKLYNRISGNYI